MKRLMIFIVLGIVLLTGCRSQDIQKANDAFQNENYKETISLLEPYNDLEVADKTILQIAKGCVAVENKDYVTAIDNLKNNTLSDAQKQLLDNAYVGLYKEKLGSTDDLKQCIKEYEKLEIDTTELDQIVIDKFTALYSAKEYDSYVKADAIIDSLVDSDLKTKLEAIREDGQNNRCSAFLLGEWRRVDGTDFDGCVISVKVTDGVINSVVKNIDSVKDNSNGIAVNDLKWKNGKIIDETSFSFDDLSLGEGSGSYVSGVGTIDYDEELINIHIAGNNSDFSSGGNQIWMKKSRYDQYPNEKITEDDYRIEYNKKGDELTDKYDDDFLKFLKGKYGSKNSSFVWLFTSEDEEEGDENMKLSRGVDLVKSTEEDVLKSYGVGEFGVFDVKTDYYMKELEEEKIRNFSQAETYINYICKDVGQITFYFDKEKKLCNIVYAYGKYEK